MRILDRQPLSEEPTDVWTPDGPLGVKPYQIIVWVSLAARRTIASAHGLPRFPAVLDTGNNHNFAIRRQHLERWAKLALSDRGRVRISGHSVPLMAGQIWAFPNEPGSAIPSDRSPLRLKVPEGIIVYPEDVPNPARLPILGLRAIVRNDLKLVIDGKRREVTLKTPGWF